MAFGEPDEQRDPEMTALKRSANHQPPRDSLTWRVIDYLGANPGERLTRSDVATKFGFDASAVDSELAGAVMAGQLLRETSDEDGIVWRLRYRGARFPAPFTGTLAAARKAVRAKRHALIDISGFKIEKGIPLIEPVKRVNQWNKLFDGMETGDSVLVPNEARMALAHAQAKYRKTATHVVFAIRKVNETHTRMWRTA
jgi:hypothetical protein